jgi:crotonobetainyl-CoA:carnitine CoA-transferase CaiB-like acyl-CoA transferase
MERLQKAGIPAGRVSNNQELLNDPHLDANSFFADIDEGDNGLRRYDGQSIRGNFLDKSEWKAGPVLGQDSKNILVKLLGYSEADCEALASDGTSILND